MGRIQKLERQVRQLSHEELVQFRKWFSDFDADVWDRDFEADVNAGKFDAAANKAEGVHEQGQTTKL